MNIEKTTDLKAHYLKILAYGPSGTGKTRFAGSMDYRFKTLFLSAESGLLVLMNLKNEDGTIRPIDFQRINKFEDLEIAYNFLKNQKHPYGAVAIDSLTEIQKVCKDHIMAKEEQDQMRQQDWGALALKIERLVRSFRDLPMHVCITALDSEDVDKITGEVKVYPSLQGSVQKSLPSYFDEVFFTYAKEVEKEGRKEVNYNILTKNSGKYIGKDRSGSLPTIMTDPSFGAVYDKIFPAITAAVTEEKK